MRLHNRAVTLSFALALTVTALSAQNTSRYGTYSRSIGNDWLGGSVYADAGASNAVGLGSETATAQLNLSGTAKLLKMSREVASLSGNVSNRIIAGNQTRSGSFRVRMLGFNIVNQSFASSGSVTRMTRTFDLFPVDPKASVPVGPFSVSISGNVGAGLSAMAGVYLPVAVPQVFLSGDVSTWAYGRASASISIPGIGVGVEVEGRVGSQQVLALLGAHARNGLVGDASYALTPITVKLIGKAWFLWWDYRNTLVEWSSAAVQRTLVQL